MSSQQIYLLGFFILILGLALAAYLLGVPAVWILVGVIVLVGIGIIVASGRSDPPGPAGRPGPPPGDGY